MIEFCSFVGSIHPVSSSGLAMVHQSATEVVDGRHQVTLSPRLYTVSPVDKNIHTFKNQSQ